MIKTIVLIILLIIFYSILIFVEIGMYKRSKKTDKLIQEYWKLEIERIKSLNKIESREK